MAGAMSPVILSRYGGTDVQALLLDGRDMNKTVAAQDWTIAPYSGCSAVLSKAFHATVPHSDDECGDIVGIWVRGRWISSQVQGLRSEVDLGGIRHGASDRVKPRKESNLRLPSCDGRCPSSYSAWGSLA